MAEVPHQELAEASLELKLAALKGLLRSLFLKGPLAIAFSGGADSSLLLKLCTETAPDHDLIHPVYISSVLNPRQDEKEAQAFCKSLGLKLNTLIVNEFLNPKIRDNPPSRCYLCKKELFLKLRAQAAALCCAGIADGTNYDDLFCYRPGLKALKELEIISPLALCKITKGEVRRLLASYHLPVSKKPSSPCLATRFAYGEHLTPEKLRAVELAENLLKALGCRDVRVRVHGDIARLELDPLDFTQALQKRADITEKLHQLGFLYVVLDLEGFRSGSMDLKLNPEDLKLPFEIFRPQLS